MKFSGTIAIAVAILGISLLAVPAFAVEAGAKPDPKPVATAVPAPAKAKVLATVGKVKITEAEVTAILVNNPRISPERIVGNMIQRELMQAYLQTVPCSEEALAAESKLLTEQLKRSGMTRAGLLKRPGMTEARLAGQIRIMAAMRDMETKATSKEKIAAAIKSSPVTYFDGTRLEASHILIMSPPYASKADKAKARAKLAEVAKQIAGGKIKFEDAAKKHSACPSGQGGGALGAFTFERMDPAFSKAAFALKGNEISDVIESSFGFHLIKVTKREKGSGKPGDNVKKMAAGMLTAAMRADMIRKAAAAIPVVINK